MERDQLQEHIFSTYLNVRYGLAVIAALFPVVVYAVGVLDGIGLQDSISAYYWASGSGDRLARIWFVGGLFVLASFLYLYKGFTKKENIALNLAALFGAGVALLPMPWDCGASCPKVTVHGICAFALFGCLVYVVWFRARDTLRYLPADSNPARYKQLYATIGAVMVASPVSAFFLNLVFGTPTTYTFFIESAGIWGFAAYWWVKSTELQKSGATRKALRGEIGDVQAS